MKKRNRRVRVVNYNLYEHDKGYCSMTKSIDGSSLRKMTSHEYKKYFGADRFNRHLSWCVLTKKCKDWRIWNGATEIKHTSIVSRGRGSRALKSFRGRG